MTAEFPQSSARRPLLVNGESLRIEVTAPRSAGGEKYEPQSPEEARQLLLPQIESVITTVQGCKTNLHGSSPFAKLHGGRPVPGYADKRNRRDRSRITS